jgi:hypothetical protein
VYSVGGASAASSAARKASWSACVHPTQRSDNQGFRLSSGKHSAAPPPAQGRALRGAVAVRLGLVRARRHDRHDSRGLDSSLGSRLTHGAPLAFQNHEGGVTRNVDMVRDRDLVRPRDCAIPCLGWYGFRGRRASAVGALQFRWHVSRLPLLLRPDARASRAEVQSPRRCSTPGGAPRVRTSPSS